MGRAEVVVEVLVEVPVEELVEASVVVLVEVLAEVDVELDELDGGTADGEELDKDDEELNEDDEELDTLLLEDEAVIDVVLLEEVGTGVLLDKSLLGKEDVKIDVLLDELLLEGVIETDVSVELDPRFGVLDELDEDGTVILDEKLLELDDGIGEVVLEVVLEESGLAIKVVMEAALLLDVLDKGARVVLELRLELEGIIEVVLEEELEVEVV